MSLRPRSLSGRLTELVVAAALLVGALLLTAKSALIMASQAVLP